MKRKLKVILQFFANPRLLLCIALAWMITNGWSYVMLGIGTFYHIEWMIWVAGGYLAFLWFPFTPEKIVTVALTILFLRLFFPRDEKTLGVMKTQFAKLKSSLKRNKSKTEEQKNQSDEL
ncbi:MAG: hypothetical protein J6B45_06035 [Clostridia bacterium]|nr:hypothetical protein [Clostridia bacterium]